MKSTLTKHACLALAGLALASSAGMAFGQATEYQWTFPTATTSDISAWTDWFGGLPVTMEWSSNDASNNPASGSLEVDVSWPAVSSDQACWWLGFGMTGNTGDTSVALNLDSYQTEQFDIMVDPDSASYTNSAGTFGNLNCIVNINWGQTTIAEYPIPASAVGHWTHVSLPIAKGLGSAWGPGFIQADWDPSACTGPVTFYIDNLTFVPAPPNVAINTQPLNEEVFAGETVNLSVDATGGKPYSFQWYKGGTALTDGGTIAGSSITTSNGVESLTISNVSSSDISSYYVVITNAVNSVTSGIVTLNVLAAPGDQFAAQTKALGPVCFFELNETNNPALSNAVAFDHVGGYAGLYQSTVSNLFDGITGPGSQKGFTNLLGTNVNGAAFFPGNNAKITLPPLNLNSANVTIAAWINPAGSQPFASSIAMCRAGTTPGSGFVFFNATDLGYNWNNDETTWNWDSGIAPPQNEWSFAVLVVTPVDATIYLFNPETTAANPQVANQVEAHAVQAFDGVTLIGQDQSNTGRTLNGTVDDVAIYNRSLSYGEVTELYASATGETVPPIVGTQPQSAERFAGSPAPVVFSASVAGVPAPTLQWQKIGGSLGANVFGATGSTLIISNATAANAGNYQLVATSSAGSVTSSVVSLTITTPVGAYANAVLALNPVAFYELNDGNDPAAGGALAFDPWGGFNASYGIAVGNGNEAIVGPEPANGYTGFPAKNSAAYIQDADSSFLDDVVTVPALGINGNNATFTAWINPANVNPLTGKTEQTQYAGLVWTRSSSAAGLAWTQTVTNSADGSLDATLGFDWGGNYWSWDSGLTVPANTWSFVALTVSPAGATISVYSTNGVSRAANTNAMPTVNLDGPLWIGGDENGSATSQRVYYGDVDEVAIFSRTLSQSELDSLADVGGVITLVHASGNQLTWNHGTLLESTSLSGPWTIVAGATSPYSFTPAGTGMFYRVENY